MNLDYLFSKIVEKSHFIFLKNEKNKKIKCKV